ncbi:MAG TPA: YafY family protein [Usitatibacter sp.]|nr:YafY family protein [Usitatibacter sp.]
MDMGVQALVVADSSGTRRKPTRMDRTERFYKIDQMLQSRGRVKVREFLAELGVSLATFKRDLEYMRSRLNAPIVWDREQEAYRFEEGRAGRGPKYELPGLWFSPSEALALLTLEHLVEGMEPGLLGAHVRPLKARLAALLTTGEHSLDEVRKRIRVIASGARRHEPKHFELIASAVLGRQRLRLVYWNRTKDETTTREVSPQRLVHYRENWYLDAWDHLRNDLRTFALDAMRGVEMVEGKVKEVPDAELDAVLASGYGIFSGRKVQWATLRFTPERARYVAMEEWHPKQRAHRESGGSYVLEIPFTSEKELAMDILQYAPDVEVVKPDSLRAEIARRAVEMARRNGPG